MVVFSWVWLIGWGWMSGLLLRRGVGVGRGWGDLRIWCEFGVSVGGKGEGVVCGWWVMASFGYTFTLGSILYLRHRGMVGKVSILISQFFFRGTTA